MISDSKSEVEKTLMNVMNNKLALYLGTLLAFSLFVGSIYIVSADSANMVDEDLDSPFSCPIGWRRRGGVWKLLDEEQRSELQEELEALREEGATFKEIQEYIRNYLEKNGIEYNWPELPEETGPKPLRPELTEEELEAWEQFRSDVREYAVKRAEELGLELPKNGGFPFFRWGRWPNRGAGICEPRTEES